MKDSSHEVGLIYVLTDDEDGALLRIEPAAI
jgi:glucose/arabinose dehydrogenase